MGSCDGTAWLPSNNWVVLQFFDILFLPNVFIIPVEKTRKHLRMRLGRENGASGAESQIPVGSYPCQNLSLSYAVSIPPGKGET
jgi:hypothetical protein